MSELEHAEPLTINGTTLATMVEGVGPPLVFVNGGVSDLRTWSGQIDTFRDRSCAIENASHIVHEDAPEAFNAALASFLKSIK